MNASRTDDIDQLAEHWRTWVGRTETVSDTVPASLTGELVNVVGVAQLAPRLDVVPPGGQWLLFNSFVDAGLVGPDGHPHRGGFLPPISLPRRMWAGGRIRYLAPISAGMAVTRTSTIMSVTVKAGSRSPLAFVTVVHEIRGEGEVLVQEEQDLVYMRIPDERVTVPDDLQASTSSTKQAADRWSVTLRPNEVMLFRYSALTRNSHRIHYDVDYARSAESYPALVVHGPLTATVLQWWALACRPGLPLRSFEFRGRAPLFVGTDVQLSAVADGDGGLDLVARAPGKAAGMTARAEF